MTPATVPSKGQITIPIAVREALHGSAGDRVEFVEVRKMDKGDWLDSPAKVEATE